MEITSPRWAFRLAPAGLNSLRSPNRPIVKAQNVRFGPLGRSRVLPYYHPCRLPVLRPALLRRYVEGPAQPFFAKRGTTEAAVNGDRPQW